MRTINLLTGGTAVGLLGVAGILLLPTAVSSAPPPPPDKLSLTGHIRDFPPNSAHIDFQVNPSATPGARSCKNIQTTLDSEFKPVFIGNGKRINQEWRDSSNRKIAWCQPLISAPANMKDNVGSTNSNDNGGIHNATSFAQWFRDVPGVNMSRLWTINLNRQSDGSYLYDTNNFNPVDFQLFGNGFDEHNFYFTYEIICEFTAGPGLWLEFKGDDDFWLFLVGPG